MDSTAVDRRNRNRDFLVGIPLFSEICGKQERGGGWVHNNPKRQTETTWPGRLLAPPIAAVLSRNHDWYSPSYTYCEEKSMLERSSEQNIEELRKQLDDEAPCSTCKYTGMATCAGLSMYFLKLATEDPRSVAAKAITKAKVQPPSHKVFYYGGAVVWAAAGFYRSMLD